VKNPESKVGLFLILSLSLLITATTSPETSPVYHSIIRHTNRIPIPRPPLLGSLRSSQNQTSRILRVLFNNILRLPSRQSQTTCRASQSCA
jgi:hypothetical protein